MLFLVIVTGIFKKWQDRECTYNVTMKGVRATIVTVWKAISITYSEGVSVALGIQHAMGMRHIVICGLPPLYYIFPRYLINGRIFGGKKFTENNVCFCFV